MSYACLEPRDEKTVSQKVNKLKSKNVAVIRKQRLFDFSIFREQACADSLFEFFSWSMAVVWGYPLELFEPYSSEGKEVHMQRLGPLALGPPCPGAHLGPMGLPKPKG